MTTKLKENNMTTTSKKASNINLFNALESLSNAKEIETFLTDLCTPQEISAFKERWEIAKLLDIGELSYREISAKTGASTTTVSRVARFLNNEPHGGYRSVLEKEHH